MKKKILIDCDPGIDDAVALCFALFDSQIEVLSVTACEGAVSAAQVNKNLQSIINLLDPPLRPRLGKAEPASDAPPENARYLHGDDGLANLSMDIDLQRAQPAEKVMSSVIRQNPGEVTIVCLGPLTNIAKLIQSQPTVAQQIDRIVICGGAVDAIGNVTACSEFNIHFDPIAAETVLRSTIPKTIVPLDVTSEIRFDHSFFGFIKDCHSNVSRVLKPMLPVLFRSFRRHHAMEDIMLRDLIGLLGAVRPNLFLMEPMAVEVETRKGLTRGLTVFDRRYPQEWENNVEVAGDPDTAGILNCIQRQLMQSCELS